MKSNNKGIALVTVIIATTFIGILGASLIYMSYMNYITKSMRMYSNDRFYSAEFVLDDISTSIQQVAADVREADIAATNEDGIKAVKAAIGGSDASTTWDPALVRSVCEASLLNNVNLEYTIDSVDPGSAAYTRSNCHGAKGCSANLLTDESDGLNRYITLHNVRIKVMDRSSTLGYQGTLITHITIKFKSDGDGDMDVNDFSIMTDRPMILDGGNFVYSGNIFIKADDPHTQYALELTGNSVMTLNGEDGIIYGGVHVGKGSALSINGNVRIVGPVIVDGGGYLIINDDDAGCSGGTSNSGTIILNGEVVSEVPSKSYNEAAIEKGIIGGLWAPSVVMLGKDGNTWVEKTLNASIDTYTPSYLAPSSFGAFMSGNYSSFGAWTGDGLNGGKGEVATSTEVTHGQSNALITLCYCGTNNAPKGSYSNCTFLAPFSTVNIGKDNTMGAAGKGAPNFSRMDKATYDGALMAMFGGGKTYQIQKTSSDLASINIRVWYSDVTGSSWTTDASKWYSGNCNMSFSNDIGTYQNYVNAVKDGTFSTTYPNVQFVSWTESCPSDSFMGQKAEGGIITKYCFCDGDSSKTYMPYGNFIRADSASYISGIFNGLEDDADPSKTDSYYSYWIKE